MTTQLKNGQVSWGDSSFDSSKKQNRKDEFLRLAPGSNVVRLLTLPHQYHQHRYLPEGGKKYGYRINCSGDKEACPLCKSGDKAKRRWFLGVVDRKTSTYKILDIGFSVFKSIQTLAKDDDWGDPSRYDLDIVVDPNGGATSYYTVVAKPPKPLSSTDLSLREEHPSTELEERVVPPTVEKIQGRLSKIAEEISAAGGTPHHTESTSTDDNESSDEEDEFQFKDADFFKNKS
jgi:hypothetical protein